MRIIEKYLPYFPLNISLLPGEDIPLRIFEPRYKQLIGECREKGIRFGIPFVKDSEIQEFGTEVRLKQVVAENSLGEMVIVIEGISLFRVLSVEETLEKKLYGGGKVMMVDFDQPVRDPELFHIIVHYTDHLDPEFLKNLKENEIFIHDIARALNLSSEEKYKYILIPNHRLREKFLLSQMKYLIKLREQEKLLKNDYSLN